MFSARIDNQAEREVRRLARLVPSSTKKANEAVAVYARRIAKRNIEKVYRRPVGPNQRPRTGQLRSSALEGRATARSLFLRFQGPSTSPIRNWQGGYFQRRSAMGVSWFPRKQVMPTIDYLGDTQRTVETQGPAIWQASFEREWK